MNTEVLVAACATRLLAAASKASMAALAVYIVRRLGTTRPRLWMLVVVGEILPAGALVLETGALIFGWGEWVYAIVAACAVGMAMSAGAAWALVSERVAGGLPPVEVPRGTLLSESEVADMVRRAELRGQAQVYAGALLARAGPPRPEA